MPDSYNGSRASSRVKHIAKGDDDDLSYQSVPRPSRNSQRRLVGGEQNRAAPLVAFVDAQRSQERQPVRRPRASPGGWIDPGESRKRRYQYMSIGLTVSKVCLTIANAYGVRNLD